MADTSLTVRRLYNALHWRVTGALGIRLDREDFLQKIPPGGVGAEIGVFRGEFTAKLLDICRPGELHLFDGWWHLYGETYPDWGAYTDFGRLPTRTAYQDTLESVERHRGKAKVEIHVGDDCELLEKIPDSYFDWVYLDSSHQYEHTARELEILNRKVKPTGLITGDDWKDDPGDPNHGASIAIQEFCERSAWKVASRDTRFNQWLLTHDA